MPYRKDGTVFRNREGRLPSGNYREYTVDTPGAAGRGSRRVVVNQDTSRTYYTDDHYRTFVQIDPTWR
ncbi:MAG: ribonuclease domain-containing protein [Acidobacteriota bacterium]